MTEIKKMEHKLYIDSVNVSEHLRINETVQATGELPEMEIEIKSDVGELLFKNTTVLSSIYLDKTGTEYTYTYRLFNHRIERESTTVMFTETSVKGYALVSEIVRTTKYKMV